MVNKLRVLAEALALYADTQNYTGGKDSVVMVDRGDAARRALGVCGVMLTAEDQQERAASSEY